MLGEIKEEQQPNKKRKWKENSSKKLYMEKPTQNGHIRIY